jgi:ATP-dependent Lon protease
MSFMSPEATVVRNYLDWLVSLPWSPAPPRDQPDLCTRSQRILDEDHHGLRKVKERIVEYLAVLKLTARTGARSCASSARRASARPRSAVDRARARPPLRARVARRRARRGRDPRHRRTYIGSLPAG